MSSTLATGTVENSGTDANVFVTLHGELGNSRELPLDNGADNFENGGVDAFNVVLANLGPLQSLRVRHDNSNDKAGWYLDRIEVRDGNTGQTAIFPCNNWLATDEGD